jgi:hypothetical protein
MSEPLSDDIRLLLMRANIFRERREQALAAALCSEVLRRNPTNPEAHSLMGDIARDQGKLKDAIEWYKLALDLAPDNPVDRKKLEAVIEKEYAAAPTGTFNRLKGDLAGQLGGAAAEMRAAAIPLTVYIALGAMICVIVLVTVTALMLGRRGSLPAPTGAAQPDSGGFTVEAEAAPSPRGGAGQEAPAARFPEGVSALEAALFDQLFQQARLLDPKCELVNVELDPVPGTVSLHLVMPQVWSPEDTRESILRVAGPLAQTAATLDTRITGVRLRCDTQENGKDRECAFVGTLAAAGNPNPESNGAAHTPAPTFATVWWRQDLAPDKSASATGGGA